MPKYSIIYANMSYKMQELIAVAKNKVEVRISGKNYTLVGVESEEYMHKVALYIDKKMNEIMRSNSQLSTSMSAILTAINVADDYFKSNNSDEAAKEDLKKLRNDLDKSNSFLKQLKQENSILNDKNSRLQLELAKKEAENMELRKLLDKSIKFDTDTDTDI